MKRAQRSFRQVRSRLLGGIVVLGYHRLGDGVDPFGLAVPFRRFAAHIDFIARHAHPMRLSDAVRAAAEGTRTRRAVVVTFDDGYVDTYEDALPLLERAGVPATVFVTTGYPGRQFWWDELTTIIMERERLPDTLELEIRGRTHSWRLSSKMQRGSAARRKVLMSMARELRVLRPVERDEVMRVVREWALATPDARPPTPDGSPLSGGARALSTSQLQCLAASPWVDIGAHTVCHPVLSTLTPAEQREEIQQSRIELQRITGRLATSFSYPHGAYSAETRSTVADAGFTIACCSTPDTLTRRSHRLAVPRLWVGDQDADSFAGWLEGWLYG